MRKFPPILNLIERRALTSVQVGSIYVPTSSIESALSKYTAQIIVLTHYDGYPYQFRGSSTLVRYREKYYMICCGHQINDCNYEYVMIFIPSVNVTISASRMIIANKNEEIVDTDLIDLRVFEFVPSNYAIDNLESLFFPLDDSRVWPNNSRNIFVIYGYPSTLQGIDYEALPLVRRQVVVSGEYVDASSSPHLHRLRMLRGEEFDADGMSGGAVLYLGSAGGGLFFIGFAGVTMRGSATSPFLHFIDAEFLKFMLQG